MRKIVTCLVVLSGFVLAEQPCVILAPVPPPKGIATWSAAGRASRHQLTYLAGKFPPGYPFRTSVKDKEVDKIEAKGGRVIILDSQYTREDLDHAKTGCITSTVP